MSGDRFRGTEILLHPVTVASFIGLLVNDYWAKRHAPSWVTGKASDAFGAIVLTALGIALVTTAAQAFNRPLPLDRRLATMVAAVVAVAVATVKTSVVGATVGGAALGLAVWPLELVGAFVTGEALHGPTAVGIIVDPLDAVTALAAFIVVGLIPKQRLRWSTGAQLARREKS